jgi:hypothetical protein
MMTNCGHDEQSGAGVLRPLSTPKNNSKKIVARWKIPLSGLLIYIGTAFSSLLARGYELLAKKTEKK